MQDIVSNNFIIEEVNKMIADEGSRKFCFNRMMALSHPGYRAEKDPGLTRVCFY